MKRKSAVLVILSINCIDASAKAHQLHNDIGETLLLNVSTPYTNKRNIINNFRMQIVFELFVEAVICS